MNLNFFIFSFDLNSKIDFLFNFHLKLFNFLNNFNINFELPTSLSIIALYDLNSIEAPDYFEDPIEIEKF